MMHKLSCLSVLCGLLVATGSVYGQDSAEGTTHHVYIHLVEERAVSQVRPVEVTLVEERVTANAPQCSEQVEQPFETKIPTKAESGETNMGMLLFVFVLAIFLGIELISKVPSQLHTPLMSGSNAISGITIVGALLAAGQGHSGFTTALGVLAVALAMINVVGGYLVTDRMLGMFKHKSGGAS